MALVAARSLLVLATPGRRRHPRVRKPDSLDASHGATATAPPPDIVVASLWLAACCCLVSERDRSLVCLAPATALPPLDANKRMLEWMPGTKGWEQAQREQMPPSQTGADDADAAARGSSGARRQAEAGGD